MKLSDEQHRLTPPELNDMFLAGMPLKDAVALEAEILKNPDVSADHWWSLINDAQYWKRGAVQ